jgi:hypothetical protein
LPLAYPLMFHTFDEISACHKKRPAQRPADISGEVK